MLQMTRRPLSIRWLLVAIVLLTLLAPVAVSAKATAGYQTGLNIWRGSDGAFAGWTRSGVDLAGGTFVLNAAATPGTDPFPVGGYNGHDYYNGGAFVVGEATSPVVTNSFAFREAIASWNATTPAGTWIETQISARVGGVWTKWYVLGIWAADDSTIERHSVKLQGDANGFVGVDTLVVTAKKAAATAFQLKVRLFRAADAPATATPSVSFLSVATSTTASRPSTTSTDDPAVPNQVLTVPECSQMVYPDGGEVWCSPTSTSMVLGYWGWAGDCEPRVRAAVDGVFDWLYDGHGNWPFNTAYAGAQTTVPNMEGYVARFSSLRQVEPWIDAGVPVVISFAWKKGQLTGAAIPSSAGHLAVITGFDAAGNPVVNDPAAAANADVTRTYNRAELERVWLENSGGTVYLIYPQGWGTP